MSFHPVKHTVFPTINTDPWFYDGDQHFQRSECETCKNCEFCHTRRLVVGGCTCGRYLQSSAEWLAWAWVLFAMTHFIVYNYTNLYSWFVDPFVVKAVKSEMSRSIAVVMPLITIITIYLFSAPTPLISRDCPRSESLVKCCRN